MQNHVCLNFFYKEKYLLKTKQMDNVTYDVFREEKEIIDNRDISTFSKLVFIIAASSANYLE